MTSPAGTVVISSHMLAEVVISDHGRLIAAARLDKFTSRGDTLEDMYLELTDRQTS